MLQRYTLLFLLWLSSGHMYGQSASIGADAGYGLGIGPNIVGTDYFSINGVGSEDQIKGTFGSGWNYGLSGYYLFNDNIGVDLRASYLQSESLKNAFFVIQNEHQGTNEEVFRKNQQSQSFQAKMFTITPSLLVSSGFDYIDPYIKLGLVLVAGRVDSELDILDIELRKRNDHGIPVESTINREQYTYEYSGGMDVGVRAGIGVNFHFSYGISAFGEVNWMSLNYTPKSRTVTEYLRDNRDLTSTLSVGEREVDYVDSYDFEGNASMGSRPVKEIKQDFPLNNIGLNIGLRFVIFNAKRDTINMYYNE